jgi:molybdate transport system regulatory protein
MDEHTGSGRTADAPESDWSDDAEPEHGGTDTSAAFEAKLHSDGVEFGRSDSALLRAIDDAGSLNEAASVLGRSYSHAHRRLATLEGAFGSLVESQRGGADGGGSVPTARAFQLLARFERLRTEFSGVADVTETVFRGQVVDRTGDVVVVETEAGPLHAVAPVAGTAVHVTVRADTVTLHHADGEVPGVETSARNRLAGRVGGIERRDGLAQVTLDVGADRPLTALLTVESARRLDLERGVEVVASFKTTATRVTPQP